MREEDIGSSRHFADKLQIGNMVLHGMLHALSLLEAAAGGEQELPPLPPLPLEPWKDPQEEGGEKKKKRQAQAQAGAEQVEQPQPQVQQKGASGRKRTA